MPFHASSAVTEQPKIKLLLSGATSVGKTRSLFTFPNLAYVHLEPRDLTEFRSLFQFQEAAPTTFEETAQDLNALVTGRVPCDSIGIDSLSAIYKQAVSLYTTVSDKGNVTTDFASVNRRMVMFAAFLYRIRDKNVILVAQQMNRLERVGNNFKNAGTKIIADENILYAVDCHIQLEISDGRRLAVVEKPLGPLTKGSTFAVPDGANFYELLMQKLGRAPVQGVAPAARPAAPASDDEAIAQRQVDAIEELFKRKQITPPERIELIRSYSGGQTDLLKHMTMPQGRLLIQALQQEKAGAA